MQGSHGSTLWGQHTKPKAFSSLWKGTVAGQSPLAQSCSLSLLQQPSALPDQLGVRCKSLGTILTTLPRKCEVTLTFPASHSGEEDKPLFAFCSFLVLEKHPPIPALSCLLPFQAKLAKQWLWWQCSLLNSSCQKLLPRPHTQEQ